MLKTKMVKSQQQLNLGKRCIDVLCTILIFANFLQI